MKLKKIKSILTDKNFLILFAIVLVGSALRLQGIFTNSFAFTYDVGRDMLALWDIVHKLDLRFIGQTTGIPGVFYGPWWYYMLVPFYILFGEDPQGVALTMSFVGIACILLSFYLGQKIGNNFLGIAMALLVAISPSLISSSVQIWNPNIAPLLVVLTFIVLAEIFISKKKTKIRIFFILGVLLALNIDVEILWGLLFLIGVCVSVVVVLRKDLNLKQLLFFMLGAFIIFLPRVLFEIRNNFLMTKSFFAFLSSKSQEDSLDLYHFIENRLNIHLDEMSKSFFPDNNFLILILVFTVPILILLLHKKSSNIINNFILTILIIIFTFYLGTTIFSRALWPHYLVGLPIVYIFLLSISLYLLTRAMKNNLFGLIIIALCLFVNYKNLLNVTNFQKPSWEGDASVYRNQLAVVDYVYSQANGRKFKYVVYTPPVYDFTYQYLFRWYGPGKYKYPPSEIANLAYFIIEPDPGYPDRPKWWLEARINDGKIIKQEKIKGGIIVQTRTN